MNAKARSVCFTFNNPSEDDIVHIQTALELRSTYAVYGVEVGASGTTHLQGYFELPKSPQTRLSTMKNWFPRKAVHLEKRKGTPAQASAYCKKGDQSHAEWTLDGADGRNYGDNASVWEHGELSHDVGRGKRTDIEKVREGIKSGEIRNTMHLLDECSSLPAIRFGMMYMNNMPTPATRAKPIVYWLYGSTGTGKSRACADLCTALSDRRGWNFWRSNRQTGWYDGYNRQEVVWMDDIRDTGKRTDFTFLLDLLDVYPLRVPIKGGFVQWSPRVVVITSPYPYAKTYERSAQLEDIGQLGRRVTKEFDFDDAGRAELESSIYQYLTTTDSNHLPRTFGDCVFADTDDESDFHSVDMESDDEVWNADALSRVNEEVESDSDVLDSEDDDAVLSDQDSGYTGDYDSIV